MRFFKRIAGFLGFAKDEGGGGGHDAEDQQEDEDDDHRTNHNHPRVYQGTGSPRKGFSVPVQVAVDRPQLGPVLLPSSSGDGGVQGLRWHAKRLKIDEDGDVADEFLEEVLPEAWTNVDEQQKPYPKFQLKYNIQPAEIKNQVISSDGKIQQCVEYQGRLQWV